MENLEGLAAEAAAKISAASDAQTLDQVRVEYLGKKGHITALLKGLGALSAEERPAAGAEINRVKEALSEQIAASKLHLDQAAVDARLAAEKIDVTLSGRGQQIGGLHPVSRTIERISAFFEGIGFEVVEGPEIEDDYHNFEALNIPACASDARYFLCG
jgi:phenylalanyl-tRNA synthetase alpha chain